MANDTPPTPTVPSHQDEACQPAEAKRIGSLILRTTIGLLIVAAAFAAGYFLTEPKATAPQGGPGDSEQRAIPVTVRTIQPVDVPIVKQYLAQTEASQTVPIRARVSGFLIEQNFVDGDLVQEGQVLFRIDPKPFEVALRRAESELKAAEAQLVRAEQQVRRFEGLAEVQRASINELEQAQEAQRVAAAAVDTQRAIIDQAALDLGYTTIRSPITGVIGARLQDVGSYVGPQADPLLATVRKLDPLYVRYSVSERDITDWQRMQAEGLISATEVTDMTVSVVLPDGRVYPHPGKIDYVDVVVDPSTGTGVIRATVPNPERKLRPGQFVHVHLGGVSRLGALAVPQKSVLHTPSGPVVYVVDQQSHAQMRPIVLGDWAGEDWIVESGLQPGERVILDHLVMMRPGVLVQPTPEAPRPAQAEADPAPTSPQAVAGSSSTPRAN